MIILRFSDFNFNICFDFFRAAYAPPPFDIRCMKNQFFGYHFNL